MRGLHPIRHLHVPEASHRAPGSWFGSSVTLLLLSLGLCLALPAHAQKELPPVINGALPDPPTLEVSHSPATLVPGQSFSMSWVASGSGVSISYVCTSAGTGFKASGTVSGLSGSLSKIADAAWAGYPSNCTWTAKNGGGSEIVDDYLVTQAPTLVNGSSVGAVSVPSSMVAGRSYSASVSMTNTGTSTWQPGVWKLGSQGPMDNVIWGKHRVALPAAVAPGGSTTFNFTVTAPATAGSANFQWAMVQEGAEWFGPTTGARAITITVPPPPATIGASHSPVTLTAGKAFSMSWSSSNASSVSYSCSNSSGVVLSGSNLATSGTINNTAQASWVNNAPRCTWTATGAGGNGSASDTLTTSPAAPTISASHSPAPLVAGQTFSMSWSSTNATGISYSCSNGGGLVLSGSTQNVSGSVSATALAGWANDAPVCTWTATNGSGSVTARDTLSTSAPPPPAPVINSVTRNPATLMAGSAFTVSWSTSNASSMAYTCTPNGGSSGYNSSASNMAASGNLSATALASWGGTSSTCVWTATGAGGTTVRYTEIVTTAVPVAAEVVTYIHTDGLGSPVARTDQNGNLISRTRYEPYGATAAGATPTIGFTGHVNDANTGLVYMQQRYYDPFAGRFLSTDPVLTDANTGASFNRYVYANNNPLRFIDPDGRQVADVGGSPETPHARCNGGNLCFGGNSVGEQIAENATASALAGNNAATYGWAFAGAYWEYFGSEGVSQVASKGSGAGSGNYAMAALEIGTLGKGKLLGQFGSKTTSLFRAVSPGEFNSIMASGKLSFAAGAAEMKQFGYKLDEVLKFANTSSEYAAIIRIQVDSKVLKHLHLSNTIDPWIFKSGVVTAVGDDALRVLNNAIISVKQAF